jgi:hypothetical protein
VAQIANPGGMMGKLSEKIEKSLANLVTLEIVTAVGRTDGTTLEPDYAQDRVMTSKIDLLQGDVTNVIDEAFVSGELAPLRAFHESQVLKGQQIVHDNLAALKALYEMAREYQSPEQPEATLGVAGVCGYAALDLAPSLGDGLDVLLARAVELGRELEWPAVAGGLVGAVRYGLGWWLRAQVNRLVA